VVYGADHIARATADRFEKRDAFEQAQIACVLLNPSAAGPDYVLPLEHYAREVKVLALMGHLLAPTVLDAVKRCVEGPRRHQPAVKQREDKLPDNDLVAHVADISMSVASQGIGLTILVSLRDALLQKVQGQLVRLGLPCDKIAWATPYGCERFEALEQGQLPAY
jgi:hypothetical protein